MKSLQHSSENINEWFSSRRWRIFVWCLPVMLAILALVIVLAMVLSRGGSELQRRYDQIARSALASGKFEEARVASLRGLNGAKNERDHAQWVFLLALALNGQGHKQDTVALISAAAPLTPIGAGCLDAHLALAESLLNSTNLTPEAVRQAKLYPTNAIGVMLHQAEGHLLSAVAIDPESVPANEMLARFYINTHQPAKARERLIKIYAAKPEAALLLAISADLENDAPSALQWAARALTTFQNNLLRSAPQYNPEDRRGLVQALMVERKYNPNPVTPSRPKTIITNSAPQDSPPIWLGIVHMLLINGKYGAALVTLEHQMQEHPDPAYPPAIGDICAALAQSIPLGPKGDSVGRLRLIKEGLTNAPENLTLQLMLVQESHETNASGVTAKMLLDQRVTESKGEDAGWWHFVLWTDDHLRGDMVSARRELQTAGRLAPNLPQIKNDIAMLDLDSTNRPDWETGLTLIQTTLSQNPYDPALRDTRGQLLARLGRNKEAKDDLEFAVTRLPNPIDTRRVLTKVYAALGIVHQDVSSDELSQVRNFIDEGDYASAVKALDHALLVNSNLVYATAMADACEAWLDNAAPKQPSERLRLIQKGLNCDPQNQKLQSRLLMATHAAGDSGLAAKKLLDHLVANAIGDSAAEWHLFLGKAARSKNDLVLARRELQTAYGLAPQRTEIQIEFANILSVGTQQDVDRALELIQPVADAFPDNAGFRNTRGRILARLGRNKEAAQDLSFAVDRLPDAADTAETRRILAKVYDALGKPQKAEEQRLLTGKSN